MSATVNAQLFAQYFEGNRVQENSKVPIIEIPGRTFPVEQLFLEEILDLTEYAIEDTSPYARSRDDFTQSSGNNPASQKFVTTKSLNEVREYVDDYELAFLNNESLRCKVILNWVS